MTRLAILFVSVWYLLLAGPGAALAAEAVEADLQIEVVLRQRDADGRYRPVQAVKIDDGQYGHLVGKLRREASEEDVASVAGLFTDCLTWSVGEGRNELAERDAAWSLVGELRRGEGNEVQLSIYLDDLERLPEPIREHLSGAAIR